MSSGLCCGWTVQKGDSDGYPCGLTNCTDVTPKMIERQIACRASCRLTVLAAVLLFVSGHVAAQETVRAKSSPAAEQTTIAPANSDTESQGGPTAPAGSAMILVSRQPVKLLAGPSSSAPSMYGFPAGRRFRMIGEESGFAQLEDVKSGAKGWIDESALGQSPAVPLAAVPSQPKPSLRSHKEISASKEVKASIPSTPHPPSHTHTKKIASTPSKTKPIHKAATAETQSETTASEQPKRRGLFGLRRNSAQGVLF